MAIRSDLGLDGQLPMAVAAAYEGILPPAPPAAPNGDAPRQVAQNTASTPPVAITVALEDGAIARLPVGTDISNVRANGADLEFVQPDGTVIVVPGGSIANLVLFLGDIQIPAEAVTLMFQTAGIEPAAGAASAAAAGADGAHGSFVDLSQQTVGAQGRGNSLLGDSEFGATDTSDIVVQDTNFAALITGGDTARIADDGLADGNKGDGSDVAVLEGAFTTNEIGVTFAFSADIAALDGVYSSNGHEIVWRLEDANHLVGEIDAGNGLEPAVTVAVNADGSWRIEILSPLDHTTPGTNTELTIDLPVVATDSGGIGTDGFLIFTVEDDTPEYVEGSIVSNEVSDAPTPGGDDEETEGVREGASIATGDLGISWGADRNIQGETEGDTFGRSLSFDFATFTGIHQANLATSGGVALREEVTLNENGGATATFYKGESSDKVFDIVLDPTSENGSYTFTLYRELDHGTTTDNITIQVAYIGTDADGDPFNGTITINAGDDVATISKPSTGLVEEEHIDVAGAGNEDADSDEDTQGDLNKTTSSAGGSLGIDWGADDTNSGLTVNRSVAFAAEQTALDALELTSHGLEVQYTIIDTADGQALIAYTGTKPTELPEGDAAAQGIVFVATISDVSDTGSWELELYDTIESYDDGAVMQGENVVTLTFAFTATDSDGDETEVSTFQVGVVDDVPVLLGEADGAYQAVVGESALLGGNGDDIDTTEKFATGDFTEEVAAGADGPLILTHIKVGAFDANVTDGQVITSAQAGQQAGLWTLTVDADGTWRFDLLDNSTHEDDEATGNDDQVDVPTITATLADADGDTIDVKLDVAINDDGPIARNDPSQEGGDYTATEGMPAAHNLMLAFDISGSMNTNDDGSDDYGSRLAFARAAAVALINASDAEHVLVVTFADNAQNHGWMTRANAISYLQGNSFPSPSGGTDYDDALTALKSAYETNRPAGDATVYFFSDGAPSGGGDDINSTELATWNNFLQTNGIDSYAVGLGGDVNANDGDLLDVARPDAGHVIILNSGNLNPMAALTNTAPQADGAHGNVLDNDDFGADGGRILSIKVGEEAYTWDGANTISKSGGGTITGSFLSVDTPIDGHLLFNFSSGAWTYQAPEEVINDADETFTYTIVDGDGDTAEADLTVDVIAVNDAPVNTVPTEIEVTEDVAIKLAGISIADADANGENVTVTLSIPNGSGALTAAGDANVSISGSSTALVLTGSVAHINAYLSSGAGVVYTPAPNANSDVTLTITTNDQGNNGLGGARTDVDTIKLDLHAVNDAPVLAPDTNTIAYTENASAVKLMPSATVTDVDNPSNFEGGFIEVKIDNAVSGDRIVLSDNDLRVQNGDIQIRTGGNNWQTIGEIVSGNLGTSTVKIELDDDATDARVEKLLRALSYESTSDNPGSTQRSVTVTFNDGQNDGSGSAESDSSTIKINVTPVNDAPVITGHNNLDSITEDPTSNPGTTVAKLLSLHNMSDPNYATDAENGVAGIAVTGVNTQGGGVWQYQHDGGPWTDMTPSASASRLLDLDDIVRFVPNVHAQTTQSTSPQTQISQPSITFRAWDGSLGQAGSTAITSTNGGSTAFSDDSETATLTITSINDAPVLTGDLQATVNEGASYQITGSDLGYTDVDDNNAGVTFTVASVTNGSVRVNGNPVTSFTGTQLAAGQVTFVHDGSETAAASFKVRVEDGNEDGSTPSDSTFTFSINPINDAPVNAVPGTQTVNEDIAKSISGLSISDADAGSANLTTTLSVQHGILNVTGTGVSGSGTGLVTITGTLAQINAALVTVSYKGNLNYNGTDTLSILTKDGGNTGSGGEKQDSDSVTINVSAVNDAPVLAPETNEITYTENSSAIALMSSATVTDPDNPSNFETGFIQVGISSAVAGDRLVLMDSGLRVSGSNVQVLVSGNWVTFGQMTSGGFSQTTLKITFDDDATDARVEKLLRAIGFESTSDNPTAADRSVTVTFNDGSKDGIGAAISDDSVITVHVAPSNDAPVLTLHGPVSGAATDDFGSGGFSGGSGWGGSWVQSDEDDRIFLDDPNGVGGGNWLYLGDASGDTYIERSVNLAGMTTASITFDVARISLTSGQDLFVQAWNSQTNQYDTIGTVSGNGSSTSATFSLLAAHMTAVGKIRFFVDNDLGDGDYFRIDNVNVSYSRAAVTFVENGPAVVLDGAALVADIELDGRNHYDGAKLILQRQGASSGDDVFGGTGGLTLSGGSVSLGGPSLGTYTQLNGVLTITFNSSATPNLVDQVLQKLTYANNDDTPDPSVTISYEFSDAGVSGSGGVKTAAGSITVNIQATNDAPTASDDSKTFNEDQTVFIGTDDFGGYADPDGTVTTVKITQIETNGSLEWKNGANQWVAVTLNQVITVADLQANKLRFVPDPNENGSPYTTIKFTVSDGSLSSPERTLTLSVTSMNDPTVTNPDSYEVAEDGVLSVDSVSGVLANDTDIDQDTLTVHVVTGPTHALAFTLNADGSFTYTPSENYFGGDSFTYRTFDGTAYSDPVTVSITVTSVNDVPTGSDDSRTFDEDQQIVLLTTDFGPYGDIDGTVVSVRITELETDGTLQFDNGTSWVDVTDEQLITLADIGAGKLRYTPGLNEHGAPYATIKFVVVDNQGASSAEKTLTLNVNSIVDQVFTDNGETRDLRAFGPAPGSATDNPWFEDGNYLDAKKGDDTVYLPNAINALGQTYADLYAANGIFQGGEGNDTIIGGDLNDRISGGVGSDNLQGGVGNDTFFLSADSIVGAGQTRTFQLGDGTTRQVNIGGLAGTADTVTGGIGTDTINLDQGAGTAFVHDTLQAPSFMSGVEAINGTTGDDVIIVSPNYLSDAAGGGITIEGGQGKDILGGGKGTDIIRGGDGDDVISGLDGADTLEGGAGADEIWGGQGGDTIDGGADDDTLIGGAGDDTILGGSGDDTIIHTVGDGNDTVNGGGEDGTSYPNYDVLLVKGDGNARTFNIGTITSGTPIVGTPSNSTDVLVSYTGDNAGSVRMDEIERIVIHTGSAGDTVIVGDLQNTALATSTIVINSGGGNDIIDLSGYVGSIKIQINDSDPIATPDSDIDLVRLAGKWTDWTAVVEGDGYKLTKAGGIIVVVKEIESFYFAGDGATIPVSQLVNQGPVAVDDLGSVVEDAANTPAADSGIADGNVLGNDTDVNSLDTKTLLGVQFGDVSTAVTGGLGADIFGTYGKLTLSSTGDYAYTLDDNNPLTDALAKDATVTETFSYTIKDAAGVTSTAQIVITVKGTNDAPVISGQNVFVHNPGFEDNNTYNEHNVEGDWTTGSPYGWTVSGPTHGGWFNPSGDSILHMEADNGQNVLFLNDRQVASQELDATAVAGTYTLKFELGDRNDAPLLGVPSLGIRIYAGNTLVGQSTWPSEPADGADWRSGSVTATIQPGSAEVGQVLRIEFENLEQQGSAGDFDHITQINIDNVSVSVIPTFVMTGIHENAVNNPGQTVAEILGASVSDVDTGAVEGIAIYGVANGNGHWEYKDGASWVTIAPTGPSDAVLLAANDVVRFVPNGANGTFASFEYYAWDRTTGTLHGTADVTNRGDATAFSLERGSASIAVSSVNDAPLPNGPFAGAVKEPGDVIGVNEAGPSGALVSTLVLNTATTNALNAILANPGTLEAQFDIIEAQLGDTAQALAVVWKFLDSNYTYYNNAVNEAGVRLAAVYADYLRDGKMPLLEVTAKYTNDGASGGINSGVANGIADRNQSLHDNLLGSVDTPSMLDKFGSNPGLLAAMQAVVSTAGLAGRPIYSGDEGASNAATVAWDKAHGFLADVTGTFTATDVDLPANTLSWTGTANGTYGVLTVNANGDWSYVLNPGAADSLPLGGTATETFNISVTDGSATVPSSLTITINGTNDAPVIVSNTATVYVAPELPGAFYEAGPGRPTLDTVANWTTTIDAAFAAHPGNFPQILHAIDANPAVAMAALWDLLDKAYVNDAWHPSTNESFIRLGLEYAKYLQAGGAPFLSTIAKYNEDGADDGNNPDRVQSLHDNLLGNTSLAALVQRFGGPGNPTYDALITAIHQAGVGDVLQRPYYSGNEGSANNALAWDQQHGYAPAATGQLTVTDVDGLASALTFTSSLTGSSGTTGTTSGVYGTFTVNANGAWTYTIDNEKLETRQLDVGDNPTESFTIKVTDAFGGVDTQVIVVNVTGYNDAPSDIALSNLVVAANNNFGDTIGTITVTDVDDTAFTFVVRNPNGSVNTDVAVVGTPGNYSLQVVNSAGVSSLPPSITITATDDNGASHTEQYALSLPVKLFSASNVLLGSFETIQGAIDAAGDGLGQYISAAAGTYTENLTIDRGVEIRGANYGIDGTASRGAETIIQGTILVTEATNLVGLNGVYVENTSNDTVAYTGVRVDGGADVTIQNSVFWSPRDNGSLEDRAIYLTTGATGDIVVDDNLIGGTAGTGGITDLFGNAAWNRGIWSDGREATLTITGNTLQNVRSGLNLDDYDPTTSTVSGNTFQSAGTALSVGGVNPASLAGITGNYFGTGAPAETPIDQIVGTELNLQNLNGGLTVNLSSISASTPDGIVTVEGSRGGDTIIGTSGTDFIFADGGASVDNSGVPLAAGSNGNDDITGGGGNDLIIGGRTRSTNVNDDTNPDTAHYSGNLNVANITALSGPDYTAALTTLFGSAGAAGLRGGIASGWQINNSANGDGTDIVADIAILDDGDADGGRVLLVGNGGFATIQAAVNDAQNGDTILIANGHYAEQVVVDGIDNLTIKAAGTGVFIDAPATLVATGTSPTSGRDVDGLITVKNATNVTIDGVNVDGDEKGSIVTGGNDPTLVGIAYLNASGTIDNVDVTGIRESDAMFGMQRGIGIYVSNSDPDGGDYTPTNGAVLKPIEISNSSVTDFQKGGIVVVNAAVDIHDNTVTGVGAHSVQAQNGIQVSGSTGSVEDNAVSAIGYTGADWSASLILTFENNGLVIQDNTLTGTGANHLVIGIAVIDSNGTTVTDNDIEAAGWAIQVEDIPSAYGWPDALKPGAGTIFSGNGFTSIGNEYLYFAADAAHPSAFDVTGTAGTDFFSGGKGNDVFHGQGGDDTISYTVGGGNDRYDGGSESAPTTPDEYDVLQIRGDAVARNVTIGKLAQSDAGNIVPTTGADLADVTITYDGADGAAVRADEIEHIDIIAGTGAINLAIGDVSGTAILPSTIGFTGGIGDDTLDLTNFAGDAHIIFNGGGGTDKLIISDVAWKDATVSKTGDVYTLTVNGQTFDVSNIESVQFSNGNVSMAQLIQAAPVANDATFSVNENAPGATAAGTVTGSDGNGSIDPSTYAFVNAGGQTSTTSADGRFVINATTGAITVAAGASLDFEASPSHSYTVRMTDTKGAYDDASVTVNLNNVNEAPTALSVTPSTVNENNAAGGATAATFALSDPDSADSVLATYTYEITGEQASKFEVVGNEIRLKSGESLNYENDASLDLTLKATNTQNTAHVITQTFAVPVGNVNEAPTALSVTAQTVTENAAAATAASFTLTDPDSTGSGFATYSYEITGEQASKFEVSGNSIKLRAGESLDFEADASLELTLKATNTQNAAHVITQTFTVPVGNVNENIPPCITMAAASGSIADDFQGGYTAANGTPNLFTTDWTEAGDDNNSGAGDIRIRTVSGSSYLRFSDTDNADDTLTRTLDLSLAKTATLSFDYQRIGLTDSNDQVFLDVSTNGTTWTRIATLGGGAANDGSFLAITPINLDAHISSATQIRFTGSSGLDTNEVIYVDNFKIDYTTQYVENASRLAITSNAVITDTTDANMQTATVMLTNAQAGDRLWLDSAQAINGGTGTLNGIPYVVTTTAGAISITFTGSATKADYEIALELVKFDSLSENPSSVDRVFQITTSDGEASSNVATLTLKVAPTNDAPATTDDTVSTAEDTAKVLALTDFGNYSDAEGSSITGVRITTLSNDGKLRYDTTGAGSWADVTTNQAITFAEINAGRLRFEPDANDNGSPYATIGFQVSDGSLYSAAKTLTVTVTATNDAPTLDLDANDSSGKTGADYQANYALGGSARAIADTDSSIGDIDNGNMSSATITLTNRQTGDVLTLGNLSGLGISGTVDTSVAGKITVTLNGSATRANYETAIEAITFSTTGSNTTDRSITVVVNDGAAASNTATSTIHVVTNQSPVAVADTLSFSSEGTPPTGAGWVQWNSNGHYYKVVDGNFSWAQANAAAGQVEGAYLATITSSQEKNFIQQVGTLGPNWYTTQWAWIGASDSATEGTWKWVTGPEAGTTLSYTFWGTGEPNDWEGGEDYASVGFVNSGRWNDGTGNAAPDGAVGDYTGYVLEWGGMAGNGGISEDASKTFSKTLLLANDTDPDGNALNIHSVAATSTKGATISYNATTGEITFNPTGVAAFQALAASASTTDTFSYTITDGNGGTSTATATITINGVNDAAVISGISTGSVIEAITGGAAGTPTATGNLSFTDVDGTADSWQAVTTATATTNGYGSYTVNAAGEWTYQLNNNNATVNALNAGNTLTDTFSVLTADGTSATVTVTINGRTDPGLPTTVTTYAVGTTPGSNAGSAYDLNSLTYVKSSDLEVDSGMERPSATISAQGTAGQTDYYKIVISQNSTVVHFDIDHAMPDLDTWLKLYSSAGPGVLGNLIDENNDRGFADEGSAHGWDAYLTAILNVGTYYLQVGRSNAQGNAFLNLTAHPYELQVSIVKPGGDPIILDLDRNGFDLTRVTSFDINHDGAADHVAWMGQGDGMLVVDLDNSAAIENGNEVFSPDFGTGGHKDSLAALATFDSNGDGKLTADDVDFGFVKVWQDVNGDGITQVGELSGLGDLGIIEIDLGANEVDLSLDGQHVFAAGGVKMADGSSLDYVGVDLGTPFAATQTGTEAADIFVLDGNATDFIADYDYADGDKVDLSSLLGDVAADDVAQYVKLEGDTLKVDFDGAGTGHDFQDVATFATSTSHVTVTIDTGFDIIIGKAD